MKLIRFLLVWIYGIKTERVNSCWIRMHIHTNVFRKCGVWHSTSDRNFVLLFFRFRGQRYWHTNRIISTENYTFPVQSNFTHTASRYKDQNVPNRLISKFFPRFHDNNIWNDFPFSIFCERLNSWCQFDVMRTKKSSSWRLRILKWKYFRNGRKLQKWTHSFKFTFFIKVI